MKLQLTIATFAALLSSTLSSAAPCDPFIQGPLTLSVPLNPDWEVAELVLEKDGKLLAKQALPVAGPGAGCRKLAIHPESGHVVVEFSQGVIGTQVASEDEILLIYKLQDQSLVESTRALLRAHEGASGEKSRTTKINVESYRIVKSKSGWTLELKQPKTKKPKLIPLS